MAAYVLAAILMIGVTSVSAQDCRLPVFSGSLGDVELGSWGSGTIELDEEEEYLEGEALKVETTGFFAGGRLILDSPQPASQFLTNPEGGYLKLVVKINEPAPVQPGGPGGFPGDMPMDPGMMDPGMMDPGMMPPGMDPGMMPPGAFPQGAYPPGMDPGMMPPGMDPAMMDPAMMDPGMMDPGMMDPGMMGQMTPPEPPAKIEQLRALIVTDLGAIDSGSIDVADYPEIVEDWVEIVIGLDQFQGAVDVSEGQIEQIAVFGNVEETFWIGDLTLGFEQQPLIADAGPNITTRVDVETEFKAAAQPGGATATYAWDFDDIDGIQGEGYGAETTWTFVTPGYYTVTLTVSDANGRKVSRVDRVNVKVTE